MAVKISNIRQIKLKWVFIFVLLLVSISALLYNKSNNNSDIILDNRVYNLISNYINKYPQFNTFILKYSPAQQREGQTIKEGYLLAPGYEDLLVKFGASFFFNIDDKKVYYISDINNLLKKDKNKWTNFKSNDSIILPFGEKDSIIIKNSSSLFILRAIYFTIEKNGILKVNNRPDTIFSPKYIGTQSVKFENLGNNRKSLYPRPSEK